MPDRRLLRAGEGEPTAERAGSAPSLVSCVVPFPNAMITIHQSQTIVHRARASRVRPATHRARAARARLGSERRACARLRRSRAVNQKERVKESGRSQALARGGHEGTGEHMAYRHAFARGVLQSRADLGGPCSWALDESRPRERGLFSHPPAHLCVPVLAHPPARGDVRPASTPGR